MAATASCLSAHRCSAYEQRFGAVHLNLGCSRDQPRTQVASQVAHAMILAPTLAPLQAQTLAPSSPLPQVLTTEVTLLLAMVLLQLPHDPALAHVNAQATSAPARASVVQRPRVQCFPRRRPTAHTRSAPVKHASSATHVALPWPRPTSSRVCPGCATAPATLPGQRQRRGPAYATARATWSRLQHNPGALSANMQEEAAVKQRRSPPR